MVLRTSLFYWTILLSLISTQLTAQDSLFVSQEDTLMVKTDSAFTHAVDSAWLKLLDERKGLIEVEKLDSALNSTPSTYNSGLFKQRFAEMNKNTPINLTYTEYLDPYINEYLRYKGQLSLLLGLNKLYFPTIESILDKNDIPLEIRNLSVVESGLNPKARSPRGAMGLWQFMLPTARECGLSIDSYVDERMDPVKSTEAACIYLQRLYDIYGVWELAIAAYNCGPGNVNKAIKLSGGSKNFWELKPYLPRETQKYVPRFMAMCYLMEYGDQHGIKAARVDHTFWDVDTVVVKKEIRFDQIAHFIDVSERDLMALNPQFKKGVVPSSTLGTPLFIPSKVILAFTEFRDQFRTYAPRKKAEYIASKHQSTYRSENNGKKTSYRIKSGDVLGTIAENHGVSVSQLKRWNNIRGTRIRAGQKLTIYVDESFTGTNTKSYQKSNTPVVLNASYTYHTVRKGDTLWDIAKLYSGVSSDDIKRLNSGINPNNLKMGSKLKIKKI